MIKKSTKPKKSKYVRKSLKSNAEKREIVSALLLAGWSYTEIYSFFGYSKTLITGVSKHLKKEHQVTSIRHVKNSTAKAVDDVKNSVVKILIKNLTFLEQENEIIERREAFEENGKQIMTTSRPNLLTVKELEILTSMLTAIIKQPYLVNSKIREAQDMPMTDLIKETMKIQAQQEYEAS